LRNEVVNEEERLKYNKTPFILDKKNNSLFVNLDYDQLEKKTGDVGEKKGITINKSWSK
jgi:hypothetical protein